MITHDFCVTLAAAKGEGKSGMKVILMEVEARDQG